MKKEVDQFVHDEANTANDIPATDIGPRLFICTLVALIGAILVTSLPRVLRDGDTGWHLAAGRFILENVSVPTRDPLSFSFYGQPWVAHEWLTQSLMFVTYEFGGWSGLVVLFALATSGTLVILTSYFLRWLTPVQAAVFLVIITPCLLPSLLARPHVLAWLVLALWAVAMLDARERGKGPSPAYSLLMLLWANMHGSYAFGLFLSAVIGLESLLAARADRRWEVIRGWGLFGLLCLLAVLFTPNGPAGLLHPLFISSMQILPHISEWQPTDLASFSAFKLALYALIFFGLFKPVQMSATRLLLLIFLLHMALAHIRHQAIFAIVGSLLLAEPLGRSWRPAFTSGSPGLVQDLRSQWRRYALGVGLATLTMLSVFGVRLAMPINRSDDIGWPGEAITNLPEGLRSERVFNDYSFGGALALERVPVFIDGRADLYGDDFVQDYIDIAVKGDLEKWHRANERWQFGWTILRPGSPLAIWLDKQEKWECIYSGPTATVHVRKQVLASREIREEAQNSCD